MGQCSYFICPEKTRKTKVNPKSSDDVNRNDCKQHYQGRDTKIFYLLKVIIILKIEPQNMRYCLVYKFECARFNFSYTGETYLRHQPEKKISQFSIFLVFQKRTILDFCNIFSIIILTELTIDLRFFIT